MLPERRKPRPLDGFVRKLVVALIFACVPAYFAWVTSNDIKPYFEEHGMGHDATHTGIVLAACIMHAILPVIMTIMQLVMPTGTCQHNSGVLALMALVFSCFVAKYAWEWRQIFGHAGEAVLAKNCLALFIITIIGLSLEGIFLGTVLVIGLGICGFVAATTSISDV